MDAVTMATDVPIDGEQPEPQVTPEATAADLFVPDGQALEPVPVALPEIGRQGYILPWLGTTRDKWDQLVTDRSRNKKRAKVNDLAAWMVAMSACDSEGHLLFSDVDAPRITKRMRAATINRYCAAVQKINGLSDEEMEEALGN